MFNKITNIICILLISILWGQEMATIENMYIDTKQNGLFLTILANQPIPKENIIGWVSKDWFYITIHHAIGDSTRLTSTPFIRPVLAVQNINAKESTQLALHINGSIEDFEFYTFEDRNEILAALYYPAETVVALMNDKEEITSEPTINFSSRIKTVLYFAGTALTVSGIIAGDGEGSGKTELTLGLLLVAGTYIYDKIQENR